MTYSLIKGGEDLAPEILFHGTRKQCLKVMQSDMSNRRYRTLKIKRERNLFTQKVVTREFRYAIVNLKKA